MYWDGRKERWHVQMQCRGKYFYGGYHSTIESARVLIWSSLIRLLAICR
ncbi:hypothetical protein HU765_20225 [Pseudomonas sp. SWRI81]|nr:hypothetical protein [Pseudomonas sp. SWRI81]